MSTPCDCGEPEGRQHQGGGRRFGDGGRCRALRNSQQLHEAIEHSVDWSVKGVAESHREVPAFSLALADSEASREITSSVLADSVNE